ncbi:MAG: CopG family transcriptional regulator [Enterocloster aldenensis]
MDKKFIVRPKNSNSKDNKIVMTIRIDRELQEEYDKLAGKSNRSRNELISMAMRYALENLEFVDYGEE